MSNKNRIHLKGKEHPNWKGDDVGYHGLHDWVRTQLGKANRCEFCKKKGKRYEWARTTMPYKREIAGWTSLCVACHKRFDHGWVRKDDKWFITCSGCERFLEKNLENFYAKAAPREFEAVCRKCSYTKHKRWVEKNREHANEYARKRRAKKMND